MASPSILLPLSSSSPAGSSSSAASSTSSHASSTSSHTSISSSSPASSASTSKPPSRSDSAPSSIRRIRFAPLPDPRRAVLITDDGDELPITPLADANTFPTSLLLPTTASLGAQTPASPKPILATFGPDPPALGPPHADDPTAYSSSSSSTHSYLSSASSSASASAASTPRTATPSEYSPVSSVGSSPVTLTASLPAKNGDSSSMSGPSSASDPSSRPQNGHSASAAPTTSSSASLWPKPRSLSLLRRPFKKSPVSSSASSSHSLTPTPSIEASAANGNGNGHAHTARKALSYSTEEILTLGTINLFRTSSRDSNDSGTTATSGWGLARWASAGNSNHANTKDSVLFSGSPLARTQSTQSYKSRSKSLFGGLASSSTSSLSDSKSKAGSAASTKAGAAKSAPAANRYKGTRMLNGRVYGSKRSAAASANLFASARDEEPEFVEWGYGGMGSVKGAKSAGVGGTAGGVNWARLQGGTAVREGVGVGSVAATEEDDGSGMGWVKRRREERERKAKEEKERLEKEQKEQEENRLNGAREVEEPEQLEEKEKEEPLDSNMSTPTPTRSSTTDGGFLALGSATAAVSLSAAVASAATPTSLASPLALGATSLVPVPDMASAEVTTHAPPFSALALGQNIYDEPGSIISAAAVKEYVINETTTEDSEGEVDEMQSHNGVPTPNAALMNEFAFSGGMSTSTPEHVPDVVPMLVRPRHPHHHSHSHTRSHSRTISLVSPTDENSADGVLAGAEAQATVNGKATVSEEGEEEAVRSGSSSESESESDVDGERNDSGDSNEEEEEEEDADEDEEDEDADPDVSSKTMLGAGVEKVMRHKDKE